MRRFTALALVVAMTAGMARAGQIRLLLTSTGPYLSSSGRALVDVNVFNDSDKAIRATSLEFLSAEWKLNDVVGKRLQRMGTSAAFIDHGDQTISLPAHGFRHRQLELKIDAEPGDLVEIVVNLGPNLESNHLLLYRKN